MADQGQQAQQGRGQLPADPAQKLEALMTQLTVNVAGMQTAQAADHAAQEKLAKQVMSFEQKLENQAAQLQAISSHLASQPSQGSTWFASQGQPFRDQDMTTDLKEFNALEGKAITGGQCAQMIQTALTKAVGPLIASLDNRVFTVQQLSLIHI